MTDLVRWLEGGISLTPSKLNRVEAKAYGRALTRMEHQAELEQRSVELEADIGRAKIHTVAQAGNEALTAQALIAGRQRLLVEAEPSGHPRHQLHRPEADHGPRRRSRRRC